jgi:hypothetical protein
MIRVKLLFLAIIGSLLGYYIINSFIISMSIWQFLLIEIIISIFHELYNIGKESFNHINPE